MKIERLQELAAWSEKNAADAERRMDAAGASGEWITGGTEVHREECINYRDLARCARAWATLERRENCELFAYPGRDNKWSFYPDLKNTWLRVPAPTAIEAVEAAEVKT